MSDKLRGVRARLKTGEYDGTDIMSAWIAIDKLIELESKLKASEAKVLFCEDRMFKLQSKLKASEAKVEELDEQNYELKKNIDCLGVQLYAVKAHIRGGSSKETFDKSFGRAMNILDDTVDKYLEDFEIKEQSEDE